MPLADFTQAAMRGQESGKSMVKVNPLGEFIKGLTQSLQERDQVRGKLSLQQAIEQQSSEKEYGLVALKSMLEQQNPLTQAKIRALDATAASKGGKSGEKEIPPAQAGLYTLANESVKNIQDVKKKLFPKGDASSFKRMTAGASNMPLSWMPGIPSSMPNNQEAQDVYRKMSAALAGRQLIQTGVAARPEETQRLYRQYAANLFSNPQSTLDGLNELEEFYKNYTKTLKTRGISSEETNGEIPDEEAYKLYLEALEE